MSRPLKSTACPSRRFGAGLLALAMAASLLGAVGPAHADEAATADASDAPAVAAQPSSAIHAGVLDALTAVQERASRSGQEVLDEKALEYARRSDVLAEQRALDALNARGQQYDQAAAEEPAAEASSQAAAGEADPAAAGADAEQAEEGSAGSGSSKARSSSESSSGSKKSSSSKKSTAKARKSTIRVLGEYIPFVQGDSTDRTAPALTASTWLSTGDVDDGLNTYFIGHNPGVFESVPKLEVGDKVVVWDTRGKKRTYYVFDKLTLPNASNYFRYEARIAPPGETITLQACSGDNKNIVCVMAK